MSAPAEASATPDDRTLVRSAADLLLRYPFQPWFYGDSVGFDALVAASDLLGDPTYESFVRGFARGAFKRDASTRPMDNTIPGKSLVALAVRRQDEVLLDALLELHDALERRPQHRGVPISLDPATVVMPYGGVHLPPDEVRLVSAPGPGVYVDCLHFDAPFTATLGWHTGDEEMLDRGRQLARSFVDLLQDPMTGLFHHFHLVDRARSYVLGWSRGQGWALLGLLDVLEVLREAEIRDERLEDAVRSCLVGMRKTRLPNGDWPAVVTRKGSPVEGSAAAFMLVALLQARALGLAGVSDDDAFLAETEHAFRHRLTGDGRLEDVSAVVWSSTQEGHYDYVSVGHTVPWGLGPAIIALCALDRSTAPAADAEERGEHAAGVVRHHRHPGAARHAEAVEGRGLGGRSTGHLPVGHRAPGGGRLVGLVDQAGALRIHRGGPVEEVADVEVHLHGPDTTQPARPSPDLRPPLADASRLR